MFGSLVFSSINHFSLVVVPLFVLMAEVVMFTGLAHDAYETTHKWLRRLPGGLGVANIVACGVFAAICGSSTATAAAIGTVTIPEMIDRKYDKKLATGVVAAGGTLGILIPPSIPMILYCTVAELAVSEMFLAGYIPGMILMGSFILTIIVRIRLNPNLAPRITEHIGKKELFYSLIYILPLMLLIITILWALYFGVATASEGAAVGALGAFFLAACYKRLTWDNLKFAFLRTVRTTSFIMLIVIAAKLFGNFMVFHNIPQHLMSLTETFGLGTYGVIALTMVLLLILGTVMDAAAVILVSTPVLLPIISSVGINPIWYGVMLVVNMEMAMLTPPVGLNLYVIQGVAGDRGVSLQDVIQGIAPFLISLLLVLLLVIAFPKVALILPEIFMGR
jgi:tripartite ATP-independent transporter DctM subunit